MRLPSLVILPAFAAVASAHFQLQYPIPRGPFVEDSEPTFCDGYTSAVQNRTVFPLSNGVIDLNSEHPQWTVGVIISTIQDPTSFSDFNSSSGYQIVVPYFQTNGEGQYCFPIDIAAAGISGAQDGANVTIQVVFDGGDGTLYQCADLTLSSSATVSSNATSGCTNVTSTASASFPSGTSASASATATASSGNAAGRNVVATYSVVAAILAGFAPFL